MTELYYEILFRGLKDKYGLDGMIPAYNRMRQALDFDPNQKRDDDGKWSREGSSSKPQKSVSEFLGKEYKGYKGQAAVEKLLKEKQGHIKAAFTRKDIGDIDLVWGDKTQGLAHIIKRRTEDKTVNVDRFVAQLGGVVENGECKLNPNTKRFEITHTGKKAVIDFRKYEKGETKFVLTAFIITKK